MFYDTFIDSEIEIHETEGKRIAQDLITLKNHESFKTWVKLLEADLYRADTLLDEANEYQNPFTATLQLFQSRTLRRYIKDLLDRITYYEKYLEEDRG